MVNIPKALQSVAHRKVSAVVRESTPASLALMNIAAGTKKSWSMPEWEEILRELDGCEDKVEDWLNMRSWLE